MKYRSLKVAYFSTFPPTQCGIATYTSDLIKGLKKNDSEYCPVLYDLVHNESERRLHSVVFKDSPQSFLNAISDINNSDIDVVDIQHEFKIFGGGNGENLLLLSEQLKKPIVSTLHTVYPKYGEIKEKIFEQLLKGSMTAFVFSNEAKQLILDKYPNLETPIKVIPHGIPSINIKKPSLIIREGKLFDSIVFISAGHLRDKKGYDMALEALEIVKAQIPPFHYIILGANHPQDKSAKLYRAHLQNMISRLGLSQNVMFIDSYIETIQMVRHIQSADIGLVPYTVPEQSSSGILSLIIGCGNPVISTPFQFAKAYVSANVGVLSTEFTVDSFSQAIKTMIERRDKWNEIGKFNHEVGRSWQWQNVASTYLSIYRQVIKENEFHK